jgi:DNA polymerase-3 subunit epsilon
MHLEKLVVLFMDCQTTGANPERGNVIEIGWARSDILDKNEGSVRINTHILRLPSERVIPPRVQRITGITEEELRDGLDPQEVWSQIISTAKVIAGLDGMETCPMVIHFAKFEMPFLLALHAENTSRSEFPFSVICTHEIARRLFPDLPRRSIRAIAGYFGYSITRLRRCTEHVGATALIWRKMVRLLDERYEIQTLDGLQRWLTQVGSSVSSQNEYPMSKQARSNLPDKPGLYRMLRSNGDLLYVGKASSLKQRVNSYFRKSSRHPEHILEMLSQAKQLDITVTESVLEAAILESDEIKRLAPPYNRVLRREGRQVLFCSTDFGEFDEVPTEKCRIGPFACREGVVRLAAISQLVQMEDACDADDGSLVTGLGIPVEYAPDREIIISGIGLFSRKHEHALRRGTAVRALGEIGKQLWLQRLREKEIEYDEPEEFELKSIHIPIWTPESVCHLLESNIVRGTYEIRRARWFVLLSESSLCWKEHKGGSSHTFHIVFENGQVRYYGHADIHDIPMPPGHRKRFAKRQRSFDLMTFDRMRVVTTEVKKAVSEKRRIALRFGPQNIMGGESLAKVFRWI